MNAFARRTFDRALQRGVSLLETMVGVLIGMIVVLVIYNILSVTEGYRRSTIGTSDAQITGLLSTFMSGRDAGNGGAGITVSGADLINCIQDETGADVRTMAVTNLNAAVRPIPLLIAKGAGALSDSFIALNSGATHVMWPVDFQATTLFSPAGLPIIVQSPNGFTAPVPTAAAPYWAIAMKNDGTGTCTIVQVTAATAPDPQGRVTLTQSAAHHTAAVYAVGPPARLLNLGPQGQATRVQYDVDDVNKVLRTTDLLTAAAPNPLAQNVVLMKVQYGIDADGDSVVDCWTPADASTCGDYTDTAVRAMTLAQLNRILAVRIGIVVRSDEPDLRVLTNPGDPVVVAEAKAVKSATRPPVVLFNCSATMARARTASS